MICIVSPMISDKLNEVVKIGDLVWAFDVESDMKIPLKVTRLYPDGEWSGTTAWTWGWA